MEVFEGTVRLSGDATRLQAVLLVAEDRLRITHREHELGNWSLADLSTELMEDGCHIGVEGEELIVSVPEPLLFAEAIGPRLSRPGDGSLLRSIREKGEPDGLARRAGAVVRRVPGAARASTIGAMAALGFAIWVPIVLVALVLLAALAALVVGSWSSMDSYVAVRLPHPVTPAMLVRGGAAGLVGAMLLAVLL